MNVIMLLCYSRSTRATTAQSRSVKISVQAEYLYGESIVKWEVQDMYAIIKTGGKQVKVTEGQEVIVEKVNAEVDETITFDQVLFIGGDEVKLGTPYVEGATVTGKVEEHGRDKKIRVFKYKPKKNYSRTQGHRQPYTKLKIEKISI